MIATVPLENIAAYNYLGCHKGGCSKIFLVAVAVRWNRPSEGVTLQLKFNDSGIRSFSDLNI